MTTQAARRFVEIVGRDRLMRGSHKTEAGCRACSETLIQRLNGKEDFLMQALYGVPHTPLYLPGSASDVAYHSGAAVELNDLQFVVRHYGVR